MWLNINRLRIAAGEAVYSGVGMAFNGFDEGHLRSLMENEADIEKHLAAAEAERHRSQNRGS
jgi:hypothetical protein